MKKLLGMRVLLVRGTTETIRAAEEVILRIGRSGQWGADEGAYNISCKELLMATTEGELYETVKAALEYAGIRVRAAHENVWWRRQQGIWLGENTIVRVR